MDEERKLIVGVDLGNDFTQLCCYSEAGELYSVSLSSDQGRYKIPTVLLAGGKGRTWLFGEEAIDAVKARPELETYLIRDIVDGLQNNRDFTIGERVFKSEELVALFMERLLNTVKEMTGALKLCGVTVALKSLDKVMEAALKQAFMRIKIGPDRLRIISYAESFMYYVVSQQKDIWINDVALFDFDAENLVFYRLMFGRKHQPLTIVSEKTDISDALNFQMMSSLGREQLINSFENVTSMMLKRQVISTVFFTGPGFESSWADEVMKNLCNGRRVFRGQNLFVKGAGYASKLFFEGGEENYLLVGEDNLKSSMAIRVIKDGGYDELPLVNIGDDYTKAKADIDVILDDTNEFDFVVHNVLKKDYVVANVTLDALDLRKDRSVRVNIKIRFADRNTCVITVRDLGFGEIYPTNHRIWEQVLQV